MVGTIPRSSLVTKLTRRKWVDLSEDKTKLNRVLTTLDMTFLGIGSTIGVGVYVLAGEVARNVAGPAVVLSFIIAAAASILAGLCYAEFGARVPKAGSAYVYSYVCIGEFIAFVVGWNLIMEYVIGVASVAKGFSTHLDALIEGHMKLTFEEYLPLGADGHLSPYFDPFAFAVTLVITAILAVGVKESTTFNNIFTGIKLFIVVFVIIAGAIYANPSNWAIRPEDLNVTELELTGHKIGVGGFMPFGWAGIMRGAATCFYAFVGFDCIATTGEEAKNPQRSIPMSFFLSLSFVTVAYISISTVLTMMVPYYLQDPYAAVPEAFHFVGFEAGKWIVSVGALIGFSASLLGTMFPLPRVLYAMANDGLIFGIFGKVHPWTKTPLVATIISGIIGAVMAGIFDLEALVDMMSIGTLTAYTFVSIGVLVLRYQAEECNTLSFGSEEGWLSQTFNFAKSKVPTKLSSSYTRWIVTIFCLMSIVLCVGLTVTEHLPGNGCYIVTGVLGFVLLLLLISISFQPVSTVPLAFRVPWVPLVPGLSILTNIYLVTNLSSPTWLRFGIWMALGLAIYVYCLIIGASDRAHFYNSAAKNQNNGTHTIGNGVHQVVSHESK